MSTKPRQLTYMERAARFPLDFSVTVVNGTPTITVPQTWQGLHLTRLGPYTSGMLKFAPRLNIAAAPVFAEFFKAIEQGGAWADILTYDGGYYARLKRGVATPLPGATKEAWGKLLSNHSRGTAIDLNAKWNRMGIPYSKLRMNGEGDLSRIIEIAHTIRVDLETPAGTIWPAGIVCGADWRGDSIDPMHFEVGTFEPA